MLSEKCYESGIDLSCFKEICLESGKNLETTILSLKSRGYFPGNIAAYVDGINFFIIPLPKINKNKNSLATPDSYSCEGELLSLNGNRLSEKKDYALFFNIFLWDFVDKKATVLTPHKEITDKIISAIKPVTSKIDLPVPHLQLEYGNKKFGVFTGYFL
jgi:hypothetical protein